MTAQVHSNCVACFFFPTLKAEKEQTVSLASIETDYEGIVSFQEGNMFGGLLKMAVAR